MKFIYLLFIAVSIISGTHAKGQQIVCSEPAGDAVNDSNTVYTYVGEWPQFPGGNEAKKEFIKKNIQFPVGAQSEVEGKVIIGFTVEKDGSLSDIKVLKSSIDAHNKDALRIVSLMPKWIPGKNNKVVVRCRYKIDIVYSRSQE